jgi:hypothetical protein
LQTHDGVLGEEKELAWDVTLCDFSTSKQTTTNLGERLHKANPAI